MKILRVTSSGFLEGGAENGIVHIQPLLEKRGHTIKVLASDYCPEMPHFNDYSYRAPHGIFRKLMFTCNLSAFFTLKRVLREFKPDVVHLHTLGTASPLILWALSGYPTVATVHGPEVYTRDLLMWSLPKSDFKHGEYKLSELRLVGKLRYFYYRYINYYLYSFGLRNVDRFVTISTYIRSRMEKQGVSSDYIPNGIKLFPYTPLSEETLSRTLIYTGRLEKYKGVEYILHALPEVIKTFPDTILYIAGTGSEGDELKALARSLSIEKHVIFLGYVARDELKKLYERSSVMLVPSVWPEICSRAGIEAMSIGRPVIGTDVGGTPDWLIDGTTGYLVPPENSDAIATSLKKLLADPKRIIEMGKNAREKAEEYDIEKHAERIEQVYKNVIATKLQTKKQTNYKA